MISTKKETRPDCNPDGLPTILRTNREWKNYVEETSLVMFA